MRKQEIFNRTLSAVSAETEVLAERILSDGKDSEVVDARYILVYMLFSAGFYSTQIAVYLKKTPRSINHILSNFSDRVRCRKIMRIQKENIERTLGNN